MEHNEKTSAALKIEEAKGALEAEVAEAIAKHERGGEALEISMYFDEDRSAESESDAALKEEIRAAVNAFHERPVVTTSNVRVQRLTAIDSDADGEVAVSVDYAYPAT